MHAPDVLVTSAAAVISAVVASGGFWAFLQRRDTMKSATTQLVLGLAHDRIVHLGMGFIEQGYITKDEYDDFVVYLYRPYSKFGGNGLADKVMREVTNLPMYRSHPITRIKGKEEKDAPFDGQATSQQQGL